MIFFGHFGENPQYAIFKCSYCHSKGNLIDIGKMFALQNALLKHSQNYNLIGKDPTKSNNYM